MSSKWCERRYTPQGVLKGSIVSRMAFCSRVSAELLYLLIERDGLVAPDHRPEWAVAKASQLYDALVKLEHSENSPSEQPPE